MLNELSEYVFNGVIGGYRIFPFVLVFFVFCVAALIVKLSRSVDVTESGKVVVRYHSPITWLKRFNAQVANNRAGYTDQEKKLLSFLIRGRNATQAFGVSLLGLILSGMGLIVIVDEPTQLKNMTILVILVVGILCLALGCWLFTKIGADDPYR